MTLPNRTMPTYSFYGDTQYPYGMLFQPPHVPLYVDAAFGSDGNDGSSWDSALLTMSAAFDRVASGGMIVFRGKVREQLETPVGVFDVTVTAAVNHPRHADNHTETENTTRGSSAATWTAPASGSTASPLLKVNQQGWRFFGITWQLSGSATACMLLHRTDDSGDDERDGGHAALINCKLQGTVGTPAGIGLQTNGTGFWMVRDCLLFGFATAIAKTGSAGGQVGWCEIVNNRFDGNTNGIVSPLYHTLVKGNAFMTGHTIETDLTGGTANIVTENVFAGNSAFETNTAGTGDFWFNNYALDTGSADVNDTTGYVEAAPNGS